MLLRVVLHLGIAPTEDSKVSGAQPRQKRRQDRQDASLTLRSWQHLPPLTAQTLGQVPTLQPKAKRTLSCWGILLEPHLAVNPSQHFCNVVIPGQKTLCCTGSKQGSSSSGFLHGSYWGLSSALRATLEADKCPVMDLLSCQGLSFIIAQKGPNQLKSECWEMRDEVACWNLQKIQVMLKEQVNQRNIVGYGCPTLMPLVSKGLAT